MLIKDNIKDWEFSRKNDLASKEVVVDCVEIGEYAFAYSNLKKIKLGNKLRKIGDGAFVSTDIETIDLSSTKITTLPVSCFFGCTNLKEVIFPKKRQYKILEDCFASSGIVRLELNNVTFIDEGAFCDCDHLIEITLSNDNAHISEDAFDKE